MTFTNDSNGCMHSTSGPGAVPAGEFMAPIYLPTGATIVQINFYYVDASVGDMNLFLVRQQPGQIPHYPALVSSSGTAGSGVTISDQFNIVVDQAFYSYALDWIPSFANNGQQICGATIIYYPPAPAAALCSLDADGNGAIDALSDGLLIMRAMFGLTGTAVTDHAIGSGTPSRTTWTQLRDFFNTSCGANFAQ